LDDPAGRYALEQKAKKWQRVAGVIIDTLRSVADTPAGVCDLTLLLMPTIFARTGDT
jgi:hypothetical protein